MKHRTTRRLYDYWFSRRAGRPAPSRADIEPSDIHTLLADTFILQAGGAAQTPFRLAGTRLCAMFDRELKGCDFRTLWQDGDAETIAAAIRLLREDASCCVVHWRGMSGDERRLTGELVLLPLTMGGSEITRVLGALAADELPYWLGTAPLGPLQIRAIRMIDSRPDRLAAGLAALTPGDRSLRPAPAGARRVAHLTVLDGGQRKG